MIDWGNLTALLIALAGLWQAWNVRQRQNAEIARLRAEGEKFGVEGADTISGAAIALLVPLREAVGELTRADRENKGRIRDLETADAEKEQRISQLEAENIELRSGIDILCRQVVELGQHPRYQPPTRKERASKAST